MKNEDHQASSPPSSPPPEHNAPQDEQNDRTRTLSGQLNDEAPASPSLWSLPKGTELGEYTLIEVIGRGGMGIVYKALQKSLNRFVALKLIPIAHKQMELLTAEARAAAKVRHPNIVGVHEIGQAHDWHFIAMELVEGPSLAEQQGDASMDPREAARLMALIARAVAHLHAHGIIHRDLKPSNILLDRNMNPHVSDFGIALMRDREMQPAQRRIISGTPNYMSPEQATGRDEQVGVRSDVYSLGCMLYGMLAGFPPFRANSTAEVIDRVIKIEPEPLQRLRSGIPAALSIICRKCLEKSPERRYASAEELAADLERFLRQEPIEAQPLNPHQKIARWMIREPALAGRVLTMATFFLVELFWFHILHVTGSRFHFAVTTILPFWALWSIWLNRLAHRRKGKTTAQLFCVTLDVAALTAILYFSQTSIAGPLIICYPLLIVSAGLWYRTYLVWQSALFAIISYGSLWWEASVARPDILQPYDFQIIFMMGLFVMGFLVTRLVHRIQVLARTLWYRREYT